MKAFFKKLDRIAERWIDTLDSDLNQPVVRAVTGDVFTHGATDNHFLAQPDVTHRSAANEAGKAVQSICDTVAETLNPPLSLPALPNSSISTQVT
jgi:hypothetical protein